MVTTRYSDQQGSKSRQKVMRLYKQWHRPISKRFIKPPYSIREQPRSTRNVVAYPRPAFSAKNRKNYAPTSFDQQVQVSQGHTFCTEIRKIEIPRSMVVEALNWWSRRASQHPAVQSPVHSWKSPTNLARSPLLVALVGRKMTVVRDQLFPQKPPGSSLWFSRTGVQPSPGSSTIELPSAFAESGAYPPDSRTLPGSPRQCSLPLACRHPPEGHQIGAREEARTWEHHHPQPTIPPPRLNRQAESRRQPVGCISWGWARPYTRRKDPPTLIPRNQTGFGGSGHETYYFGVGRPRVNLYWDRTSTVRKRTGGSCCVDWYLKREMDRWTVSTKWRGETHLFGRRDRSRLKRKWRLFCGPSINRRKSSQEWGKTKTTLELTHSGIFPGSITAGCLSSRLTEIILIGLMYGIVLS